MPVARLSKFFVALLIMFQFSTWKERFWKI